jgi:hypothetical protein
LILCSSLSPSPNEVVYNFRHTSTEICYFIKPLGTAVPHVRKCDGGSMNKQWYGMTWGWALALAINKLGVGRFRAINWGWRLHSDSDVCPVTVTFRFFPFYSLRRTGRFDTTELFV